jgi:hypothetical protein
MASGRGQFSQQVNAWVRASKERMLAVRNQAIEELVEEIQTPVAKGGRMPVATGYLRSSFVAALGRAPLQATSRPTVVGKAGLAKAGLPRFAAPDAGALTLVLLSAKLTDTVTVGWTANYAAHVEFGAQGRPARRFASLGIQRWPQIVESVAARAMARTSGKGAV